MSRTELLRTRLFSSSSPKRPKNIAVVLGTTALAYMCQHHVYGMKLTERLLSWIGIGPKSELEMILQSLDFHLEHTKQWASRAPSDDRYKGLAQCCFESLGTDLIRHCSQLVCTLDINNKLDPSAIAQLPKRKQRRINKWIRQVQTSVETTDRIINEYKQAYEEYESSIGFDQTTRIFMGDLPRDYPAFFDIFLPNGNQYLLDIDHGPKAIPPTLDHLSYLFCIASMAYNERRALGDRNLASLYL